MNQTRKRPPRHHVRVLTEDQLSVLIHALYAWSLETERVATGSDLRQRRRPHRTDLDRREGRRSYDLMWHEHATASTLYTWLSAAHAVDIRSIEDPGNA